MSFNNIHYTQQQVRGGHFGTRNNVIIENNNVYLDGGAPKPPKINFWQGLLSGLTGGSIFGGCGMPGMFGGCGMGGMMPWSMGSFSLPTFQGLLTNTTTKQGSAEVTLEQSTQQLKTNFGSRYNIEYIDNKICITDKSGNEIYRGTSIDDAQQALVGRNSKLDQQTADAAKKKEAMEKEDLVEVDGKYYKKDDTEHKTEYQYDSKTGTFSKKEAPIKPKAAEQEE